jgi:hypothetical protein
MIRNARKKKAAAKKGNKSFHRVHSFLIGLRFINNSFSSSELRLLNRYNDSIRYWEEPDKEQRNFTYADYVPTASIIAFAWQRINPTNINKKILDQATIVWQTVWHIIPHADNFRMSSFTISSTLNSSLIGLANSSLVLALISIIGFLDGTCCSVQYLFQLLLLNH